MDLVSAPGAKVIVVMEHVNKSGEPKILPSCKLPLTGKNVVTRLITDMVRMIVLFLIYGFTLRWFPFYFHLLPSLKRLKLFVSDLFLSWTFYIVLFH